MKVNEYLANELMGQNRPAPGTNAAAWSEVASKLQPGNRSRRVRAPSLIQRLLKSLGVNV